MSTKKIVLMGLLISVFVASILSFYASANPDGLEFVAEQVGFLNTAKDSVAASSPLSDYALTGLENERFSVAISGVVGVTLTAVLAFGLFTFLKKR
jgi:ABC-type proline/glycine betaine transport system permease subunit